jgi:hypothetical protein
VSGTRVAESRTPCNRPDELSKAPAMSPMGILQVSHDHTGAVVVDILKRLVWKSTKGTLPKYRQSPSSMMNGRGKKQFDCSLKEEDTGAQDLERELVKRTKEMRQST